VTESSSRPTPRISQVSTCGVVHVCVCFSPSASTILWLVWISGRGIIRFVLCSLGHCTLNFAVAPPKSWIRNISKPAA
jgi:hypothetical protein